MILGSSRQQSGNGIVTNTNVRSFQADVIQASNKTPIIVDLWAPSNPDCATLDLMLEKAVRATNGAVRMVKVNISQNKELIQHFRVHSLPAVFIFYKEKVIHHFVGLMQEAQLSQLVQNFVALGNELEGVEAFIKEAAHQVEGGNYEAALEIYQKAYTSYPQNVDILVGLIKTYLSLDNLEQAHLVWVSLADETKSLPEFTSVKALLTIAEQAAAIDEKDVPTLQEKIQNNPDDYQSLFNLALYFMNKESNKAIDYLLEILKKDRYWNNEIVMKQILTLFDAWGVMDTRTVRGRRRLSSVLFV